MSQGEGVGGGLRKLGAAALDLVAIDALCIHVAAVADKQLELAVGHGGGADADEGVAQLIEADGWRNAVGLLVALPAAIEGALRADGEKRGAVVDLHAGGAQESHLRLIGGAGVGAHVEGADGVLVLALGDLAVDVDRPAQVDGVALDVAIPEAQQLARAHAGGYRKAVRIDEVIKDCLAVPGAGVYRKEDAQGIRLEDILLAQTGALGHRQVLGEKCGILVQAAPFDEGPLHRTDALQGLFAERAAQRLALALLLEASLLVRLVEDGLQVGLGKVGDLQPAAYGENVVFPVLLALGKIRRTGGAGQLLQPVGIELGHLGGRADDALVEPGVGLGIRLPLAGAAGFKTIEAAALAVFLYVDLPAAEAFLPDGRACSFAHGFTSCFRIAGKTGVW